MRASGRSTLLTTRITGSRASSALRSTNRVCGNGPSLASTSRRTPSPIASPPPTAPHRQRPLAPPAEVRVARCVDDVDLDAAVADGRVLRQDRDALLALEIH